jgi:putative transposase
VAGSLFPSGNGLVFDAQRFRATGRENRLKLELITPCCPLQNGQIVGFFRCLKEECVWLQRSTTYTQARRVITKWIDWYYTGGPHQSLDCRSPLEYRQHLQLVA